MNILVRNLPRRITEQELMELFSPFGQIKSCNIVMDEKTGKSKGFGFVEIVDVQHAKRAVYALNGKKIDGQAIRVKSTLQRKK
ncbi:MAG: RNA-binding protein [Spirochaetaceae bacterium]|nr:MAG: RNA-binding protein [Spirochaetaceae bacterium]